MCCIVMLMFAQVLLLLHGVCVGVAHTVFCIAREEGYMMCVGVVVGCWLLVTSLLLWLLCSRFLLAALSLVCFHSCRQQ